MDGFICKIIKTSITYLCFIFFLNRHQTKIVLSGDEMLFIVFGKFLLCL